MGGVRSFLLRSSDRATYRSTDTHADTVQDGDPYSDAVLGANAHAYGPHDSHSHPAPGCPLCDANADTVSINAEVRRDL